MDQLKEQKINAFIEGLKKDDSSSTMSALDLLDKIEEAGILDAVELEELKSVERVANKENATFKSAVLSNLVYTRYDDVVEFINEKKINGETPSLNDIIDSGKLTKDTSPLDVASLAYYAKTFTPVNVLPEGQFSFNNYRALDEANVLGAKAKMSVSYKNGVYRADDNLAMAMTLMSEGVDGKPELNVSFRGTDTDSKNKMVEPDGTVLERKNGMFDRYIPETYLDMTGHKRRAFGPLVEAINSVVQGTENRFAKEQGLGVYDYKAKEGNRIPVVATGHSLGGGMVEEWTKNNSNGRVASLEDSIKSGFASAGYLKAHGAYEKMQERFQNDLQKDLPGEVELKSITFGAPSNSRNGLASFTADLTRVIKKSVVEFNILGIAASGVNKELEKVQDISANQELQEKIISIDNFGKMMRGELGGNIQHLREKSGCEDFGKFSYGKFASAHTDYERQMNDAILKRDLEVYCTPYDPVAKHLLGLGLSRKPGDYNVVQPLAQTDPTFSVATEGINDRYKKDGIEPPEGKEPEKKTFLGAMKNMAKTVVSVMAKAVDYVALKTFSKFSDRNFNIDYHSMKAYVGTSMLKASPLRDGESPAQMSPMDKLAYLVEMKAKKDIVAMEVITKEAGIENVVRDYQEKVKNGSKEVFDYSAFKSKVNAWENMPGADALTQQMTARFQEIKETFGNIIPLSSKEVPAVSADIAKEMNKTTQQKLEEEGLPKRFEVYKGRSLEQQQTEALNFVQGKVAFTQAVIDFTEQVQNTDLAKFTEAQKNDNPMLKPKENHVMYLDETTFKRPEKYAFGVPEGMEPVKISPNGVEEVAIRRASPDSNSWERALGKPAVSSMTYSAQEQAPVVLNPNEKSMPLVLDLNAIHAGRYGTLNDNSMELDPSKITIEKSNKMRMG